MKFIEYVIHLSKYGKYELRGIKLIHKLNNILKFGHLYIECKLNYIHSLLCEFMIVVQMFCEVIWQSFGTEY